MEKNDKKDVTLLLGKKLLLGWTMLNDVCKDCVIVPLVEDKKNNVILCVSCDRTLKRDEKKNIVEDKLNIHKDSNDIINIVSSTASTPIPSPTTIEDISKKDIEMKDQTDNNNNNNNNNKPISNKNNYSTSYYDDYDDYDYDEDIEPLTEEEKILIEKKIKKSDEFSSKMGEFLLKGWTLLSDICPNYDCFGVPLLKDREKRFYCVSCQQSGLNVGDLKIKQQPQQPTQQPQPQPQQSQPQVPQQVPQLTQQQQKSIVTQNDISSETIENKVNITPIKSNNTNPINHYSNISPPYPEPDQKKQKMVAPFTPTQNKHNNSFLSQTSFTSTNSSIINEEIQELPDFTDHTLKILFEKLKDAQTQLVQTNNVQYCSLIREYSLTISSLLEMKKNWI
ncbi:hypothetical protein DICPUDRAFT_89700 [Dictyostelium purpureum]|uniref:Sjogrens syndrome scleroderma autoantigen 1 family protein n=1 Tax=Dictyostelium purpureum TaxID=5786 RepID=F0ZXM1_DICPU|nr:uncharacterized protein DICPUDRAFT_89700 [Dictyostelium purpureum]EGC31322.1 hypothetical protein DICPUDRAFT_89700 [Dictyostelium purpureum]|eukprot:XP_003292166.1 hypothetical protein DICPUDRAFT_89700 [Dictyostelium purpureum]